MSFIDPYQCLFLLFFLKKLKSAYPFIYVQWFLALPWLKKTRQGNSCPLDSVGDLKQVEGEVYEWKSNTYEAI